MSSASAVTSHAAALAAVAASSRADARARVASSVGAAPRSVSRAPRARAAVRARAASFSSGDAAPELVEGPRGEVYASTDEAFAYASRDGDTFDDSFEDVGASQSGSGGYGARRTTRKKKGRKSSGYAQGTRGAASRSREYERGAGGAFGSRSENTGFFSQASGSFDVRTGYDVRTAREDRRRRSDDHLFECVGAEWRERERLAGPTRALQRAADRGDADDLSPSIESPSRSDRANTTHDGDRSSTRSDWSPFERARHRNRAKDVPMVERGGRRVSVSCTSLDSDAQLLMAPRHCQSWLHREALRKSFDLNPLDVT